MKSSRPDRLTPHEPLEFIDSTHVRVGGRSILYFGGCNYLGLAREPRVIRAMQEGLANGSVQPSASRATTGNHTLYQQAERAIAGFFHQPDAALLGCGYLGPIAAVQILKTESTHCLINDLSHACVQDAALISGLPVLQFENGNIERLRKMFRQLGARSRPLLLTDGTFGTRGGMPPLNDYLRLLPRHAWMFVDDAHGAGAVGPGGRGALAQLGLQDPRIIQSISLAKAIGVAGGAVLGPVRWINRLRTSSAAFVGTTSIPLSVPAGILASLKLLTKQVGRVERLQQSFKQLSDFLPEHPSISNSPFTPVTRISLGSPHQISKLHQALTCRGIYPSYISYLAATHSGFFRFALSSVHKPSEIRLLAEGIRDGLDARCPTFNRSASPDGRAGRSFPSP